MMRTVVEIDEGKWEGTVDVAVEHSIGFADDIYQVQIEATDGGRVILRASADLLRCVAVEILNNTLGEMAFGEGKLHT